MADCSLEFKPEDVHRFGSQRTYKKYLKFKRNIDVDLNPDLRWCPDPKCMHYVEREGRSKVSTCECGATVCIECGEYEHPGTKCGQQEDDLFKKWKLSQDGKNCPKCNMVIVKNEGCNHMTCLKCQHEFCWYCLQPSAYSDNHYQGVLKCPVGQFGAATYNEVLAGMQRRHWDLCGYLFKTFMVGSLACPACLCEGGICCWPLAIAFLALCVPLFFVIYLLTLPYCWCKYYRRNKLAIHRMKLGHGRPS